MKTLSMEDKKFAILIDGDNTSSKYIKTIIDEFTAIGQNPIWILGRKYYLNILSLRCSSILIRRVKTQPIRL